jgi:hypothetical protein
MGSHRPPANDYPCIAQPSRRGYGVDRTSSAGGLPAHAPETRCRTQRTPSSEAAKPSAVLSMLVGPRSFNRLVSIWARRHEVRPLAALTHKRLPAFAHHGLRLKVGSRVAAITGHQRCLNRAVGCDAREPQVHPLTVFTALLGTRLAADDAGCIVLAFIRALPLRGNRLQCAAAS